VYSFSSEQHIIRAGFPEEACGYPASLFSPVCFLMEEFRLAMAYFIKFSPVNDFNLKTWFFF
jgi:hypothetical protein